MGTSGAPGAAPVIPVEGLVKRHGEIRVVDGIDSEVAGGEVFGPLGPNWAGKTTTVEILEGLRSPDGRRATVLGVNVANLNAISCFVPSMLGLSVMQVGIFAAIPPVAIARS